MTWSASFVLLLTFAFTAFFDVVLQLCHNGYMRIPFIEDSDWYISLKPYFKKHTPLAAALVAGFVGFMAQCIIYLLVGFPPAHKNAGPVRYAVFAVVTALVSGGVGFIMKATKLFPHLDETYYKDLGPTRAFVTDLYSGLVVQAAMVVVYFFASLVKSK